MRGLNYAHLEEIAIIDLGTNTFHLLIAEINSDSVQVKEKNRIPVKIGEGGISHKILTDTAIERALTALSSFKTKIDEYGISKVYAFATSAIRNAENKDSLLKQIKKKVGLEVKVISGDEEAELIYRGIKSGINIGEETSLMVDIGGGSVEFIIGNQDKIFWKKSFEVGAQRLKDQFHKNDPITDEEIELLDDFLDDKLEPLVEALKEYNPHLIIGSSGTFETLSDIYINRFNPTKKVKPGEMPFDIEAFPTIFNELVSKDYEDRLLIPGMIPLRANMIVVAVCLVDRILHYQKFDRIRVSTHSLKEGILDTLKNDQ